MQPGASRLVGMPDNAPIPKYVYPPEQQDALPSYDVPPSYDAPPAYDAAETLPNDQNVWQYFINKQGKKPTDIKELFNFANENKFKLQYHEVADIFLECQKQAKTISTSYYSDISNEEIWNEYIKQHGTAPQNASELHEFAKTAQPNNTMKYSKAREIFDKETTQKPKKSQLKTVQQSNTSDNTKQVEKVNSTDQSVWEYFISKQRKKPTDIKELYNFANENKFGLQYHQVADIFLEAQRQEKPISRNYYKDISNEEIWNEYIKDYGYTPKSASELHEFAKTVQPNNTMKYSKAREIFESKGMSQPNDTIKYSEVQNKDVLQKPQSQKIHNTQQNSKQNTQQSSNSGCCIIL